MSGFDPQSGVPIQAQPDEAVVTAPAGGWGFVFGLLHLAVGGVAVALAVDEGFAAGKAAFAADAWRWVLGGVGAVLALLAVRGLVRAAGGQTRSLTPELRRTAARRGRVLVLVGAWFVATAASDGLAEETIAFDAWTKPFFMAGGIYLALLGLSMQLDPTGPLRRQRLERGYGAAGSARIVGVAVTDETAAELPVVRVELDIESEGRTFRGSERVVEQEEMRPLLVVGATVNVLVDRGDPRVFRVDWNSWRAPASTEPS